VRHVSRTGAGLVIAVAIALGLGVVPTRAIAQHNEGRQPSPHERAERLYRDGLRSYDLAEWDRAIAAFKTAYELSQAPELLYNLGQAHRFKRPPGCAQAAWYFRAFLRAQPRSPRRAGIELLVREMERCARQQQRAAADERMSQSSRPPASAPQSQPSPTAATAQPAPSPTGVDLDGHGSPPPPRRRLWPALTLASGLVLAVGGTALLLWSNSRYDHFESTCAPGCSKDAVSSAARAQTAGWIVVGVGAAVTLAGGVLMIKTGRKAEGRGVALAPTWGGLLARGAF
jgi:hypothetical protein